MTLCGQTSTHVPHSQQLPYATTSFIICLKVVCSTGRELSRAADAESTRGGQDTRSSSSTGSG